MSRWQKIAGLFIVGVKDFQYSAELKSLLKEFPVSGIALFNSPFDKPSNLWSDPDSALEAIHEFVVKTQEHGVFLCVDQEGGRVRRFRKPFIQLPAAGILGEAFENEALHPDQAFQIYRMEAEQLKAAGISLNFAPCVDLGFEQGNEVIGDRSFSSRIDTVIELGKIYCEAYRSADVATCLKHLPGHGSAAFDSHEKIAVLQKSKEEILQRDFKIFEELSSFASAVMTAHISFPEEEDRVFSLDADYFKEFKDRLPTHLRFITDDLITMKAVKDRDPSWKAVKAGYDFCLLCGNLDESMAQLERATKMMEEEGVDFQAEQTWDLRIRHSKEAYPTEEIDQDFGRWRTSILEQTRDFEEITSSLECFQ